MQNISVFYKSSFINLFITASNSTPNNTYAHAEIVITMTDEQMGDEPYLSVDVNSLCNGQPIKLLNSI